MVLAAGSLAVLLFALGPAEAFDRELALSDYARLKRHLSEAYANLEWVVGRRNLDLRALDAETTRAINEATSARAARRAIKTFVASFRDPHFSARELTPSMRSGIGDGSGITSAMTARRACAALGFGARDLGFDLGFEKEPGFRRVSSGDANPFPAGVLRLDTGARFGVIRIAHFGEDGYPPVCREVWEAYSSRVEEMCRDGWCGAFRTKVQDRLLAYLEQRITDLRMAGYDALVVDVTGNGGGTDWVHAAAEIVSPAPLTCGRSSFVKHPHWTKITASMLADVDADLGLEGLPGTTRRTLETARAALQGLHEQTRAPCDRSALWNNPLADLGCSNIVDGAYACGIFPALAPEALRGVGSPGLYHKALQNEHTPHVNTAPVVVLIDGGTASASELFGAVLQDSEAALLMGSRSHGAGCGFVNGGIPLTLENVGLEIMAPDCARFRTDGTNEIEGLQPDIELDWSARDSARSKTRKVLAALRSLVF